MQRSIAPKGRVPVKPQISHRNLSCFDLTVCINLDSRERASLLVATRAPVSMLSCGCTACSLSVRYYFNHSLSVQTL